MILGILTAIKAFLPVGGLLLGGVVAHQTVSRFTDYRFEYYWDYSRQQSFVDDKLQTMQHCIVKYGQTTGKKYWVEYYK